MPTPATGAAPANREGAEGLHIDEIRHAETAVLALHGELDLSTAPRLRMALADLLRAAGVDVVVDLSELRFLDSTGLAALLNAQRRLTRARRRLVLVCPDGPVLRVLRLTRLDGTFRVVATRREALAHLRAPARAA